MRAARAVAAVTVKTLDSAAHVVADTLMPADDDKRPLRGGREIGGRQGHLLSLDTLGKLIDHGCEASLWCRTCKSVGDIDLAGLAARLGRDWMFVGQAWPVTCPRCGSNDVEARIAATQTSTDGRSRYRRS